jgi:Winged helix-turn-helix DNA-binding
MSDAVAEQKPFREMVNAAFKEIEEAEAKVGDAREAATEAQARAGVEGFTSRFSGTKVSLLDLSEEDLLPPETLPGSNGVIIKGARHLWPMERKGGKSLATLVTSVDMVLEGCRVVILDRENGFRRYGLRLKDIVTARDYGAKDRDLIRRGLSYYNFPQIRRGDRRDFVQELGSADLVVFDSSRAFLSSLGLEEDSSDQYATFMGGVIDPLFEKGVSTLILDNTGHSDKTRGRGTSSKGDLNEQLFTSEKSKDFDRDTTGEVALEVEASRDGVPGRWTMALGGNVYGSWERSDGPAINRKGAGKGAKGSGEKAERKKQMRALLEEEPTMTNKVLAEALGISPKTVTTYRAELVAED